jgi:hypothetical protein
MTVLITTKQRVRWTGKRFGEWEVLSVPFVPKGKKSKHVLCRCTCSTTSVVGCSALLRGRSRKCTACACTVHGHRAANSQSPTYTSWRGINQRTTEPNNPDFPRYFGFIDPRWMGKGGFQTFVSEVGVRPPNTSAGRFLDLGAYSTRTFSWMTHQQQLWHKKEARVLMDVVEENQITPVELWHLLGMYRRIWKDQQLQVKEQTKKGTLTA